MRVAISITLLLAAITATRACACPAVGHPDVTPSSMICTCTSTPLRVTFVSKLDFRSGLGHDPLRTRGQGPHNLISDMGEFDYAHGRMRLISYHPGVTPAQIQARTGFELEIAPDVRETPPPTEED